MVEQILKQCTVVGNVVYLPKGQLERKLYTDVSKALNLIGGTWKGGKIAGFVFKEDPTELLSQLAGGEKRNLKKETQAFFTPAALADRLVELAEILPEHTIAEPSAGAGAIMSAIHRRFRNHHINWCELNDLNITMAQRTIDNEGIHATFMCKDFLSLNSGLLFDRIIANPPFSKNQDIDHLYKMYQHLKENGRIVSICSPHFKFAPEKKATEFKKWLEVVNAQIIDVPAGAFKESGTSISTVILIIDKQ